jgi:hypothetical protein
VSAWIWIGQRGIAIRLNPPDVKEVTPHFLRRSPSLSRYRILQAATGEEAAAVANADDDNGNDDHEDRTVFGCAIVIIKGVRSTEMTFIGGSVAHMPIVANLLPESDELTKRQSNYTSS